MNTKKLIFRILIISLNFIGIIKTARHIFQDEDIDTSHSMQQTPISTSSSQSSTSIPSGSKSGREQIDSALASIASTSTNSSQTSLPVSSLRSTTPDKPATSSLSSSISSDTQKKRAHEELELDDKTRSEILRTKTEHSSSTSSGTAKIKSGGSTRLIPNPCSLATTQKITYLLITDKGKIYKVPTNYDSENRGYTEAILQLCGIKNPLLDSNIEEQEEESKKPLTDVNEKKESSGTISRSPDTTAKTDLSKEVLQAALLQTIFDHNKTHLEKLISSGIDVNFSIEKYKGATPLISAARGDVNIVRLLIESGAHINAMDNNGKTALMEASLVGHRDIVKLLIDSGANVNLRDKMGRTALMLADYDSYILNGDRAGSFTGKDVVKLLIAAKTDLEITDNKGCTYLLTVAKEKSVASISMLQLLTECRANIEAVDAEGKTALMHAVMLGHMKKIEVLLQAGASLEKVDKFGKRAIDYAHDLVIGRLLNQWDKEQIINLLIDEDKNRKEAHKRDTQSIALAKVAINTGNNITNAENNDKCAIC